MKRTSKSVDVDNSEAFAELLETCRGLPFRAHDIARQLDNRGHYDLPLDREFPFHVTLFHFKSGQFTPTWNWHERLELTMPLDGPARMRMGDATVALSAGDLLVVDNMKLHNPEDFPGFDTRVIVMSFMLEFVYTPSSPTCDYTFLLPFLTKREGHPHVMRASDKVASPVYLGMAELLRRYFHSSETSHLHCGCKASFLEILFHLMKRFQTSEVLRSEFMQYRQLADRLSRLFEYVRIKYAERITVEQAAALVHMSQPQFMKVFKKVTGTTFVAHVTRVRITNALRFLRETNFTIADIAATTGFPDQSYFDRRFKQAFGSSPRQFRKNLTNRARSQ